MSADSECPQAVSRRSHRTTEKKQTNKALFHGHRHAGGCELAKGKSAWHTEGGRRILL
jgi:hypothetical protein